MPEEGNRSFYREPGSQFATTSRAWASPTLSCCPGDRTPLYGSAIKPGTSPTIPVWHAAGPGCSDRPSPSLRGIGVILDRASHFPGETSTAWPTSMARTSISSTPTRSLAFIPTGRVASSSTSCHERCVFPALLRSGWTVPTSMAGVDAVASMLYLDTMALPARCSSTTAARRTSPPSTSAPPSTRKSIELSRYSDHRRGIDGLADGLAANAPGRPASAGLKWWTWADGDTLAVHAPRELAHHGSFITTNCCSAWSTPTGENHCRDAAVGRRGGSSTARCTAAGQDDGRCVAEVRQPAAAVRLPFRRLLGKKLLFMGDELGQGRDGTTTAVSTGTCFDALRPRRRARMWVQWPT